MAVSPSDIDKTNPAGWPEAALEMFQRAITVEYTSLTRAGAPIMVPLTPFLGQDRLTVDVSTGLTYPTKAERARRNPKVCLLFSDPIGSGLPNPPVVLVGYGPRQGHPGQHRPLCSSRTRQAAGGVPRDTTIRVAPTHGLFCADLDRGDANPHLVVEIGIARPGTGSMDGASNDYRAPF